MSVFISWTGADREIKNIIAERLNQENIPYWESDEYCASDFSKECIENIRRSSIFLIIVSDASMSTRSYVINELIEAREQENDGNLNIIVYKVTDNPLTDRFKMQLNHISDANNLARIQRFGKSGGLDTLIKRVRFLLDRRAHGVPEKPYDVLRPKINGVPVTASGYFIENSRDEAIAQIKDAFSTSNTIILSKLFGFGKKTTIRRYIYESNYTCATEVQGMHSCISDFFVNNFHFSNINDDVFEKNDPRSIIQSKFEFLKRLDNNHIIIVSDVIFDEDRDEFILDLLGSLRCHIVFITQDSAEAYKDYIPVIEINRMETKYLLDLFFHYYDRDTTLDHSELIPHLEEFFDDIGGHTKTVEIAASVLSREIRADSDEILGFLAPGSNSNRSLTDRILEKLSGFITMEDFSDDAINTLLITALTAHPVIDENELYKLMSEYGISDRRIITELDNRRWITCNYASHTVHIEPIIAQICVSEFLKSYSIPSMIFEYMANECYTPTCTTDSVSVTNFYSRMENFFRLLHLDSSSEIFKILITEVMSASADINIIEECTSRFQAEFKELRKSSGNTPGEKQLFQINTSVWIISYILPILKTRSISSVIWNLNSTQSFSVDNITDILDNLFGDIADDDLVISSLEKLNSSEKDESDDLLTGLYNSFLACFIDKDISGMRKQFGIIIDYLEKHPDMLMESGFEDQLLIIIKVLHQSCCNMGAYQTIIAILDRLLMLSWDSYYTHQLLILYVRLHIDSEKDPADTLELINAADEIFNEFADDKSITLERRTNAKRIHYALYSYVLSLNNDTDNAIEYFNKFISIGIETHISLATDIIDTIINRLLIHKRIDEAIIFIESNLDFLKSVSTDETLPAKYPESAQTLISLRDILLERKSSPPTAGGIITDKNYYQRYSSEKKNNIITMMTYNRIAKSVSGFDFSSYSTEDFLAHTEKLRQRASSGESKMKLAPEAFALVSEAGFRALGYRHHFVQYVGAAAMLDGKIAEILNGEGKTYTITLVAYVNSLYSKKTFVLDCSPYLTERNYKWMKGVYDLLGLKTELMLQGKNDNFSSDSDIVYSGLSALGYYTIRTENEKVFSEYSEYNIIIDEADTILIEYADIPYKLIGPSRTDYNHLNMCNRAFEIAYKIKNDENFCTADENSIYLKQDVYPLIEQAYDINCDDITQAATLVKIEKLIRNAVYALKNKNSREYIIKNNIVMTENTSNGTISPINYEMGYFIALANGLPLDYYKNQLSKKENLINIIYVFELLKRFGNISGTSATASSFKKEFKTIYNLDVVAIPPALPVQRTDETYTLFISKAYKDEAIIDMIEEKHAREQPVLLIVKNLTECEHFSELLTERNITHNVLNAVNSEQSPEMLANAGLPGNVLIATQIANRGVDIKLGGNAERLTLYEMAQCGFNISELDEILYKNHTQETIESQIYQAYYAIYQKNNALVLANKSKVIAAGGLCVISSEPYTDMRIEQQIRGRAGRQGEPGESYFFESMDDELFVKVMGKNKELILKMCDESIRVIDTKFLRKAIESCKTRLHHSYFCNMKRASDISRRTELSKNKFYSLKKGIAECSVSFSDILEYWYTNKKSIDTLYRIVNDSDFNESDIIYFLYDCYPDISDEDYDTPQEYLRIMAEKYIADRPCKKEQLITLLVHCIKIAYEHHIASMTTFEDVYRYETIKNADKFFLQTYNKDIEEKLCEAADIWLRSIR